jgi:hypothetical protein
VPHLLADPRRLQEPPVLQEGRKAHQKEVRHRLLRDPLEAGGDSGLATAVEIDARVEGESPQDGTRDDVPVRQLLELFESGPELRGARRRQHRVELSERLVENRGGAGQVQVGPDARDRRLAIRNLCLDPSLIVLDGGHDSSGPSPAPARRGIALFGPPQSLLDAVLGEQAREPVDLGLGRRHLPSLLGLPVRVAVRVVELRIELQVGQVVLGLLDAGGGRGVSFQGDAGRLDRGVVRGERRRRRAGRDRLLAPEPGFLQVQLGLLLLEREGVAGLLLRHLGLEPHQIARLGPIQRSQRREDGVDLGGVVVQRLLGRGLVGLRLPQHRRGVDQPQGRLVAIDLLEPRPAHVGLDS